MARRPRPPAAPAAAFGHDAAAWSSPSQQFPLGIEDPEADDVSTGDMGSGSYFTNLLGTDVEESQNRSRTTNTPIDQGPPASKGSKGRTKNFTDEEDKLLVSAWINVGMDPIQGVDQPQSSFWARIHDYFHANKKSFMSDRTQVSLLNRWSGIQHDVNTFCSCLTRIQYRNHQLMTRRQEAQEIFFDELLENS